METSFVNFIQQNTMIFYGFVFMSAMLFAIAFGSLTANWLEVRRRAVAGGSARVGREEQPYLLAYRQNTGIFGAILPQDEAEKSELRRFLNMAGYYGRSAPVIYQLVRIVLGISLGMATAFLAGLLFVNLPYFIIIPVSLLMALLGYMLPRTIVSLRRDGLCEEHRQGFPDFLDLLVICVEAGIGAEAAIERVGPDLARGYPSLARNLGFMTMEIRAGKSTKDALETLGKRLGIDEARSFATLIRQSEELGTSLVQSLRVYSDEMRLKRLTRAEEKAHALPVKLVIPLGIFIFPVIMGVTMLPVALRLIKLMAM
ncbi:MAG: type II secretion system F family protein [Alphaproteobacteria bacterium]|nr:MAG: type II secretion system F family protein [Alphaproteobacteria bacterium]